MLGDFRFQKFAAMRIEPQQGIFLISSHHSAGTGHVAGKDGRKPSFDPRTSHVKRPDLCAMSQVYGASGGFVYRDHDLLCLSWVRLAPDRDSSRTLHDQSGKPASLRAARIGVETSGVLAAT